MRFGARLARLQAVQVVGGALRVTGGGEHEALVVPKHLQPRGNVSCVIRAHLGGNAKVGTEEGLAQLGDELLLGIALVAIPQAAEVTTKALRVLGPVGERPVAAWLSASRKVSKGGICT